MGGGIAQVVAASGRRVSLHDSVPGAVERGLETMQRSLGKLAEKGGPEPDDVLGRVLPESSLNPHALCLPIPSSAARHRFIVAQSGAIGR